VSCYRHSFLCISNVYNHPVVTLTLHISGLTASRNRRLLVHGQHKSTSWIDIQSSDSHALLRSNTSGLRRYYCPRNFQIIDLTVNWQLYPSLFERVKEKILEGKFQPVGGSWVESDCNMPSGESLIRQFLFGQRYFETKFGKRCETSFLPDSFGMSGALPQLMRGAGVSAILNFFLSATSDLLLRNEVFSCNKVIMVRCYIFS
jgi:hypothetical protein